MPGVLVARAATAATETTTTTTATKTATTTAAAAAKAAAAAILARFGFIDSQVAAVELLAIALSDRRLGLFLRGHFDEAEAARTSGVAVLDHSS